MTDIKTNVLQLAANISDEKLRINKGMAICFTHAADVTDNTSQYRIN